MLSNKYEKKWKLIKEYKNMIDVKYYGIQNHLTEILREPKYSEKLIGGELKKISYNDATIIYNIEKDLNEKEKDLNIQLFTINRSKQCGLIVIDPDNKTEASFQDIHADDGCYVSTLENTQHGKNIIELMIEICKNYGIKKIILSDKSHKKLGNYEVNLSKYYTMIKGYPWYCQFGFINANKDDKQKIKENYLKINKKKVSDFDEKVFIFDDYMKLSREFKNMNIGLFIKLLSYYNVKVFVNLYEKIYENLKLNKIENRLYVLKL